VRFGHELLLVVYGSVDAYDGFVFGGIVRSVLTLFWRLIHERFAVGLTAVVAFVRFAIRVGSVLFCDVGVVQFFGPLLVVFAGLYCAIFRSFFCLFCRYL